MNKAALKRKSAFSVDDSWVLKGIAIILMMFHHCYRTVDRFEGYTVSFFPFTQDRIVELSYMFKICVSIFAFISGYGLYLSAKNKCNDIKSTEKWTISRLIKTLSGFWFVYVLVFISTQIYAQYPQQVYCTESYTLGGIWAVIDFLGLANLFATPTLVGTWWYMSAAIVFIIAVPLSIKWIDKLGLFSLLAILIIIPRILGLDYLGGTSAYIFLPAMITGLIFAKYELFQKIDDFKIFKNKTLSEITKFVILLALIIIGEFIYRHIYISKVWEYTYAIYPVIVIAFCRKYIARIPILNKILIFFGKHSMNIFLVHTFIRENFFKDFIYGFERFWLIVLVLFSISLAISVIIIEPLKKLVRYNKLIDKFSRKVCSLIH